MDDTPKRMVTKEEVKNALGRYILTGPEFANEATKEREDLESGTELDGIMPIFKDSLTVISAPPKSGKSLFMLHLALNLAWSGNLVLYLSLENSKAQDKKRLLNACDTYGKKPPDLWCYVNVRSIPSSQKAQSVLAFISKFEEYDAVFIDATERITQMGESGSEISKNGRDLLDSLLNARSDNENTPALICTWQYNKQNLNNKIEEASLASLGGSISAVQIADNIWTILRDKKSNRWVAKLLNSREEYNIENDTFDVWDGSRFTLIDDTKELREELKKVR